MQPFIQTLFPKSITTPSQTASSAGSASSVSSSPAQSMSDNSILGMMSGVTQTLVKSNKSSRDPKDSAVGLGAAVLQENLYESLDSVINPGEKSVPQEEWAQNLVKAGPSKLAARQELRKSFMKGEKNDKFAEQLGVPIPGIDVNDLKGFRE